MSLVYIKSEKNKSMLVYSFLHTQEKMYNEKKYWKCSKRKKFKFKGRVQIVNKNFVKSTTHNNHVPSATKMYVKIELNEFKNLM